MSDPLTLRVARILRPDYMALSRRAARGSFSEC